MNRSAVIVVAVVLGVWAFESAGKARASRPAKVPDLCNGPIDPYDLGRERSRFLRAAGADNELTGEEFASDAKRPGGFVRKFDRWEGLRAHDRNANKTIDWFEAKAYRLALRTKVLAAFDADKDGRLRGPERDAANRALARGEISGRARRAPRTRPGERRRAMRDSYDLDGDGTIDPQERRAAFEAMRKQRQEQMLSRYDADGDGKLDEQERQSMMQARRGEGNAMRQATEQWRIRLFDEDGDGRLGEAEQAASREFTMKFTEIGRRLRRRSMDIDGDGEVSDEERRAAGRQWRRTGFEMMIRVASEMDTDGDGKVSPQERDEFGRRVRTGISRWFETFTQKYDADADGKFNGEERQAMLEGIRRDLDARYEKSDADGDGRLDGRESMRFVTGIGRELGILRANGQKRPATTPAAGGQ